MKKINELRDYLLENYIDDYGALNISGLDFSEFDGDVDISFMKVKGDLFLESQEVEGSLFLESRRVQGDYHCKNVQVKEGWEKLVESINDVLTVDGGADMIDKKTLQDIKKSQPIKVQVPHEANNLGSNLVSHLRVCDRLNEIYASKNKDYGNSFGEQYQEYGITSSVIRLDDKMRRLKQITKSGAKVEDETIEDTLLDLANYAILTLMELEGQDE